MLVAPDDPVWIDVWVPVGDPLWTDDVGRAFDWLGDAWAAALARARASTACRVHDRASCWLRPVGPVWSASAASATGEVVTADGRKVVGLAQRRNRHGAWFHGACVLHWEPRPLVELLALR